MTAVMSKIISMQNSLTVIENEIAQYVMDFSEDVITSTISAIAQKTKTSEASVNRFCKKLGFKGFNSFKVTLAQESYFKSMQERGNHDTSSFTASISRDYHQMILNTSAMLDEETVLHAVIAIRSAARIYIFSTTSTAFTAKELEFRLSVVGLNVQCVTDVNNMRIFASGVQSRDLVIVVAPTILMRDIFQAVNISKERGAKVLSITSYDAPQLNTLADFKFVTSDKIIARNALSLSNNLIFLYVVDVLYSVLLNSDKKLRQKKLDIDAMLGSNLITDNYLLEY